MSKNGQRCAQLSENSLLLLRVSDTQSHLSFTSPQAGDDEATGVQRGKAIYSRSPSKPHQVPSQNRPSQSRILDCETDWGESGEDWRGLLTYALVILI